MIRSVQIGGLRLLIIYLIALPFLYAYHDVLHEHASIKSINSESEVLQVDTKCAFCDLYFSQTTISYPLHAISFDVIAFSHTRQFTSIVFINTSHENSFLRGPPFS